MQQLNLMLVAFGMIGGGALGFFLGYSSHGLLVAIFGTTIGAAGGACTLIWLLPATADAIDRPQP
jgi:hypothetical protein